MAVQAMTQSEINAFVKKVEETAAQEGRENKKWVYPSMAAAAWGVGEDVVDDLILKGTLPTKVVENENEPKVTYVDASCAPVKNEDALRWGRAEPEHITYKVAQPVHAAAAAVMKTKEWDELVKRYEAGERWTDRTAELLDGMGKAMEAVLPNTGNTAGINGILLHAVHTNDAGEAIRIITALGSKKTRAAKDKDEEKDDKDE